MNDKKLTRINHMIKKTFIIWFYKLMGLVCSRIETFLTKTSNLIM